MVINLGEYPFVARTEADIDRVAKWVQCGAEKAIKQTIEAVKQAPGSEFGDDEEAIAAEILSQIGI